MVHFTFAHTFFDDKTNKSEVTRDFVVAVVVGVTRNGARNRLGSIMNTFVSLSKHILFSISGVLFIYHFPKFS